MAIRFKILTYAFLHVFFAANAQEIPLRGLCYLHNSGYRSGKITMLPGVTVSALYTKPTQSGEGGDFQLIFVGQAVGTPVMLDVQKSGYELVNPRDVQPATLGRIAPVKVFLAPRGQVDRERARLYGVSLQALTAKHDTTIARLQRGGEAAKAAIAEMEANLHRQFRDHFEAEAFLKQQFEATKARLPEFALELARTNLDFASAMYRKAYAHFEKGQIDSAIVVLDEAILDAEAARAIELLDSIKVWQALLDSAEAREQRRLLELIRTGDLKARALAEQGQPVEALALYRQIITRFDTITHAAFYVDSALRASAALHLQMGASAQALACQRARIALQRRFAPPDLLLLYAAYLDAAALEDKLSEVDSALTHWIQAFEIQCTDPKITDGRIGIDPVHLKDRIEAHAAWLESQNAYLLALGHLKAAHRLPLDDKTLKTLERRIAKLQKLLESAPSR